MFNVFKKRIEQPFQATQQQNVNVVSSLLTFLRYTLFRLFVKRFANKNKTILILKRNITSCYRLTITVILHITIAIYIYYVRQPASDIYQTLSLMTFCDASYGNA